MSQTTKAVSELPPLGLYRHYKAGTLHEVVDYAILQPSLETLLLYRPASMPHTKWACTIAEFTALVDRGGEQVPKFSLVRKEGDDAV